MVLYTLDAKVVPAAEIVLLSNGEVLLAPLWVGLVLGETASAAILLGGTVLLVAVVVSSISGARWFRDA